jgi:ribonuclease III
MSSASREREGREVELRALAARLGHTFGDLALLDRALTHSSRTNEDKAGTLRHNEPLEFLGDAVVGLCVTQLLHEQDPDGPEGPKSRAKAEIVSARSLARRAEALALPALLVLGRGEEKTGGRHKTALWADAFEAVIAALYLDGGLDVTAAFLRGVFGDEIRSGVHLGRVDHKTALQERLQGEGRGLPEYVTVAEEGPLHRRRFRVACVVAGERLGEAEAHSKKEAQQLAAAQALENLACLAQSTESIQPPPRHSSPS